jgi:hypothetical protein
VDSEGSGLISGCNFGIFNGSELVSGRLFVLEDSIPCLVFGVLDVCCETRQCRHSDEADEVVDKVLRRYPQVWTLERISGCLTVDSKGSGLLSGRLLGVFNGPEVISGRFVGA